MNHDLQNAVKHLRFLLDEWKAIKDRTNGKLHGELSSSKVMEYTDKLTNDVTALLESMHG